MGRVAKSFILMIAVGTFCFGFMAQAEAQIFSNIDTMQSYGDTARPGEEMYIWINLTNTFNVGGFSFRIAFDTLRLDLDTVFMTVHSRILSIFGADTTSPGILHFFAAGLDPANQFIPPGYGTIAIIRFNVLDNAPEGDFDIVFTDSMLGDNSLSDSTGLQTIIPVLVNSTSHVLNPTGVAGDQINLPERLWLGNYPNPFNSSTTISFNLPAESKILINIFDILGRKVRSLNLGNLSAGDHIVLWNSLDDSEREVCSGIYCYLLYANENPVKSKRMVLLR